VSNQCSKAYYKQAYACSTSNYFPIYLFDIFVWISHCSLKHRWTPITETCLALQHTFCHLVNANAYLTPPDAQGFEAHFDWMDAFVLQLHGTKRWSIYSQLQANPSPETKFKPTAAELGQPIADIILHPGKFDIWRSSFISLLRMHCSIPKRPACYSIAQLILTVHCCCNCVVCR
jgi:Cupin superfamily protein